MTRPKNLSTNTSLYARVMANRNTQRAVTKAGGKHNNASAETDLERADHAYLDTANTPSDVLAHLESGIANIGGGHTAVSLCDATGDAADDYGDDDDDEEEDEDDTTRVATGRISAVNSFVPISDSPAAAIASTSSTITGQAAATASSATPQQSVLPPNNSVAAITGHMTADDDSWMYDDNIIQLCAVEQQRDLTQQHRQQQHNRQLDVNAGSAAAVICKQYISDNEASIDDDFRRLLEVEANVAIRISKMVTCAIDNLRHGGGAGGDATIGGYAPRHTPLFERCSYIRQLVDDSIFKKNMAKKKKNNTNNVSHLFFSVNKMKNSRATVSVDFNQFTEDTTEMKAQGLLIATIFVINNSNLRKVKDINKCFVPPLSSSSDRVTNEMEICDYDDDVPMSHLLLDNDVGLSSGPETSRPNPLSLISTDCRELYNFFINGNSYLHLLILRYAFITFVASSATMG